MAMSCIKARDFLKLSSASIQFFFLVFLRNGCWESWIHSVKAINLKCHILQKIYLKCWKMILILK